MVNVITTSSDHELHLLTCTTDQAPKREIAGGGGGTNWVK